MSHDVLFSIRSRRSPTSLHHMFVVGLVSWLAACTPTQVRYQPATDAPRAPGSVDGIVYLVGDAGEVSAPRQEVLADLRERLESEVRENPRAPIVVAFLGDNIYDEGLSSAPSDEDIAKLDGQVQALPSHPSIQGVFLPGNHDWANGASLVDGRDAVARQSDWVTRVSPDGTFRFLPADGCPGPTTRDLGESVHLVFIDTEWLLRNPNDRCGTAEDFYARLTADLRANRDRRVIIMSHHPLVSGGPHGGNIAPLERGPFVYYLVRKSGAAVQDLSSRRYSTVVRELREAIATSGTRPLVHAAGHDHTLQVIGMSGPGSPWFQLVSGAGSKSERSRRVDGMRYATDGFGYMRLEFTSEGVVLDVFARDVDAGPVRPVFGCRLSAGDTIGSCPEAPLVGAQH